MSLQNIILIFLPLIAALARTASIIPQSNHQLIPEVGISRDADYALVSLPNQTIGDYFDRLVSEDQSTLSGRTIYRTQAFTEAIWTDSTINFNISMSRCVTMSDRAGLYTAKIGNLPNATVQDIVDDLQAREGSEAANRVEYSSRVKENADLAIIATNKLLGVAIADYTPITTADESNAHSELRHLLALAEMVVLIIRSSLTTEILVAGFAGVLGQVFGEVDQSVGATLCAVHLFSLQMAIGIQKIVQERPVDFVSATVFNVFLAWVRDSVRAFAGGHLPEGTPSFLPSVAYDTLVNGRWRNQTEKGSFQDGSTWPLAQDLVKKALGALGYIDQPRGRFMAATGFRPGNTCPVPRT